jgi:hypothetical protein
MHGVALFSLAVLPLLYQIVDITNWQRIAAVFRRDPAGRGEIALPAFKLAYLRYATEAPALWLVLMAFGGLAFAYSGPFGSGDPFNEFLERLVQRGTLFDSIVLISLTIGVFAIALSTMDAVLSASLFAFRYDILPFLTPKLRPEAKTDEALERRAVRASTWFGLVGYSIVFGGFIVLDRFATFGTSAYLSVLVGFYTAQLAFVPLLLGAMFETGGTGHLSAPIGPGAAIAVLLAGAATGLGVTVAGLLTSDDALSWWATPGCLLASSATFGVMRGLAGRKSA